MRSVVLMVLLVGWSHIDRSSIAQAQPSTIQHRDGTIDTLSPLGDNDAIYSDPHGNRGVTHQGSGLPSHSFSSPHGAAPGTLTPFGTPAPPNLLTPAPLLPLYPRGMATPQPQAPASSGAPGGINSFSGRPGR